ncbi:ubiquitin-activating enzyme E1 [Pycnococcus provasolii]
MSPPATDLLSSSHLLMVGAGGIGCELLKTLVIAKATRIHIIDLDTIDVSNLNRQFLFRNKHVGMSKAIVAREAALAFLPPARRDQCSITAHHANIKQPEFGVEFFKQFDVVLNGLDNVDARRHVNRLCLAARVPLVESGTTGLVGQVTCHVRGVSACYECKPKPTAKAYPVCTLRNTPDKPIHTIVWAKDMLFKQLFGGDGVVTDLAEAENNNNNTNNEDSNPQEEQTNADDVAAKFFKPEDGEQPYDFLVRVFRRVFVDDIVKVNGMDDLWEKQGRRRPVTLPVDRYKSNDAVKKTASANDAKEGESSPDNEVLGLSASAAAALGYDDDHAVSFGCKSSNADAKEKCATAPPPDHDAHVFLASGVRLLRRKLALASSRGSDDGVAFDKDDVLATEFVTAASNLRSRCYGIPRQSVFNAKGMAGNIVHAVATTNAIVAGLIVAEARKVLRYVAAAEGSDERAAVASKLRDTYVVPFPQCPGSKYCIQPTSPEEAHAGCYVCGGGAGGITLSLDTNVWTLGELASFLKKKLSMHLPLLETDEAGQLYEEGDDLDEDEVERYETLAKKRLAELPGDGIVDGTTVNLQDLSQDFNVKVVVRHVADLDEEEYPELCIWDVEGGIKPVANAPAQEEAEKNDGNGASAAGDDDDDLVMIDEDIEVLTENVQAPPAKKARRV